jgi:MYXO-CTERM domain-containing protein
MRLLPLVVAIAAVSCATSDETPNVTPQLGESTRIINGTDSTNDQDSAVMLIHVNQDPAIGTPGKTGSLCTAVMIAPKLALTARHCVSLTDDASECGSDGTPLVGAGIHSDYDAKDLYVFTGKNRPQFTHFVPNGGDLDQTKLTAQAKGAQVITDHSGTLCNHDIALVVLDTPLTVPIATIRRDWDPTVNEKVINVGWGITTTELEPSVRQQRRDVVVRRLGPNDGYPALTRSEFLLGEGICLGDSGGPVYDETSKAVLGVVSRGTNGGDEDPQHPGATCPDADNVMTKLSPFKELFDTGFTAAGAQPKLDPKPDDKGCNASGHSNGAGTAAEFVIILGALAAIRRRRK